MWSTSPAAAALDTSPAPTGRAATSCGAIRARFVSQEKSKLWPQAQLHSQWPGTGEPDDDASMQLASGQLPAIESFTKQQVLNRDAPVALLDKIGPSILLVHSQAGAFGWPVADARPDLVKAILAIEPNGHRFIRRFRRRARLVQGRAGGAAVLDGGRTL